MNTNGVIFQVNIKLGSLKNNPGSNSDIDNKSKPDLMLLRMLSECL